MKYLPRSRDLARKKKLHAVGFLVGLSFRQQALLKLFLITSFCSALSFTSDFSHDVQTKSVFSCLVPWSSPRENHVCSSWNTCRTQRFNSRCVVWFPRKTNGYMLQWPECKGEDFLKSDLIDHPDLPTLTVWPWDSRFGLPTHGHGTTTHGKTKGTNKVKNTMKQIICRCCFHLMHIFEVSRFEDLISRFFWAFFHNLQICMWSGLEGLDHLDSRTLQKLLIQLPDFQFPVGSLSFVI